MASFIRCPECGFCIGMYIKFVDEAKAALYKEKVYNKDSEYAKYDPEKLYFKPNVMPTLGPVFDCLGINNRCCRMHILTKTEFDKMYK